MTTLQSHLIGIDCGFGQDSKCTNSQETDDRQLKGGEANDCHLFSALYRSLCEVQQYEPGRVNLLLTYVLIR